jgi:hypothetical protein
MSRRMWSIQLKELGKPKYAGAGARRCGGNQLEAAYGQRNH